MELARHAERLGAPISDYVLAPKAPPGVFLVVKADARHHSALKYLKLGDGPYHVLAQNYHLCHLEIPITIRRSAVG
jgi:predicted homoserine dehydrogenase-like protein